MKKLKYLACSAALLSITGAAHAQAAGKPIDLAVGYAAERSLRANTGQNVWTQGGSIELGASFWRGWGVALNVTGVHTDSLGTGNVPLSLVTTTAGPRYRWHAGHKLSVYGEGLVGEANGFRSVFPAVGGVQSDANGLAVQTGGGVDFALGSRYAVRVIDASYLRTQLPNATDNVQNIFRVGAGFVVRFR